MNSLGHELIDHVDEIVERWLETWCESAHPDPDLTEAALKDHLPLQLRIIGQQLCELSRADDPKQIWQVSERLDPEARVDQRVPIEEVVQEYRIAADTVRDWIEERGIEVSTREYSYFYSAIFELTAESVKRYAAYETNRVSRDRSEYLAGLAHQMRGPLSTLSMQAAMLETGGCDSEDLAPALVRSIKRLTLLVNGVMRLERFKPDEIPVRPRAMRVAELIDQVIGDNEHEAARKGLRLDVAVNRTLEMHLDPDLFLDALGNLVQNAVKYTSEGFVRVALEELPDEVLFEVCDSGPGISRERRAKLFAPVAPEKAGGVGIGLAVAHRAVSAQSGAIGVDSEPGQGSRFWFRLPRVVPARD